jgi:SAM-dependent methyltransferase
MMAKLLEKAGSDAFSLVQGDATRLPFRDAVFGAGLVVHVLHLIPNWRNALDELVRVIRPRGAIVSSIGDDNDDEPSMWEELTARFRLEAELAPHFPGFNRSEEIDEAMAALGATRRDLEAVPETKSRTAREIVHLMESGMFSFTWGVDADMLRHAAQRVRAWAVERYGSLDAADDNPYTIPWRAYDLP